MKTARRIFLYFAYSESEACTLSPYVSRIRGHFLLVHFYNITIYGNRQNQ